MKDSTLLLPIAPVFSIRNQCHGKKRYEYKHRALKDARGLAETTRKKFTIYLCPHCNMYHVGSVR